MATPPNLQQLTLALTSQGLPTPHPLFLTPILTPPGSTTQRTLASLVATAKIRLLAADISLPCILAHTTPVFPPNITDVRIATRKLENDVVVQVLDVEDLSKSKWEQIEALESERKGETTKGREVIRVVPAENLDPSTASTQGTGTQAGGHAQGKQGPYKIMLQDCKGTRVYGFELKRVEKVGYPPLMGIGCKVSLRRGTQVARGMVLLEPETTVVLGGRIDGLDKAWREGREQRLREQVERDRVPAGGERDQDDD